MEIEENGIVGAVAGAHGKLIGGNNSLFTKDGMIHICPQRCTDDNEKNEGGKARPVKKLVSKPDAEERQGPEQPVYNKKCRQ